MYPVPEQFQTLGEELGASNAALPYFPQPVVYDPQGAGQPSIDLGINVGVNEQPQDNVYEVVLNLNAKGTTGEGKDVAFVVELAYGGLFQLQNVPQEHLNLFLIVEAPRLLFPYARRVFADAVRDGGFPPLMIDPIDFAQLFQQRMAEERARQQVQPS